MNINTTKGLMDESLLEKRTGVDEDDRARAEWVEYWHAGELVHRSVNMALKGVTFNLKQGVLNG